MARVFEADLWLGLTYCMLITGVSEAARGLRLPRDPDLFSTFIPLGVADGARRHMLAAR